MKVIIMIVVKGICIHMDMTVVVGDILMLKNK